MKNATATGFEPASRANAAPIIDRVASPCRRGGASKVALALLLCLAIPAAAEPPQDAPLAPDVPDTSVRLVMGQGAPFPGRLLSDEENLRRARVTADCKATLADAEGNGVLLPKAAVAALIGVGAAAVITSVVLGVALAAKK